MLSEDVDDPVSGEKPAASSEAVDSGPFEDVWFRRQCIVAFPKQLHGLNCEFASMFSPALCSAASGIPA